ncbi:putative SNF2 domain-containing protein [Cryptosporidium canis]|uniref:SNF2 domain-containing protein n=1 Tax=Cryptosporidium canis TaxID=195482 RepID=A0A9D5DGX5_9CRYT|nr:putative SNF2 domain-containing protein [Cryptosporidium canis]
MGRKKAQPVRYGGSEVYVEGLEGSIWGLAGREGEGSDWEVDLGAEEAGADLGGRRVVVKGSMASPAGVDELVCCLGTWTNVKMVIAERGVQDSTESQGLWRDQRRELLVVLRASEESRARCECIILGDAAEGAGETECSLRPRAPPSQVRKALSILQDGGFIAFTCEILGAKRIHTASRGSSSGGGGEYRESSLNTNVRMCLSRRALDGKQLSRRREGRSSLKAVLSWLNEELRLPALESRRSGSKRDSLRAVQIKPNELYSIFQDYDISTKRMGSSQVSRRDWRLELGLTSELRDYQKDAVLFALEVERKGAQIHLEYPPYWLRLEVPALKGEGTDLLYINVISGEISLNSLPVGGGTFLVRGGFLCDEMGLGKSLEIISLTLINPRTEYHTNTRRQNKEEPILGMPKKENEEDLPLMECPCGVPSPVISLRPVVCEKCGGRFHYECCIGDEIEVAAPRLELLCSVCQSVEPSERLRTKATLIVAPGSIVDQWFDEFNKHLESGRLRVSKYQGVRYIQNYLRDRSLGKGKYRKSGSDMIRTRRDILDFDVVLTSYEILKEEIYHVLDQESLASKRSMRHRKTYPILASLLTNIDWWRIVLDEAQMTEGYSLVSKMTSKLICYNKWCVSGTPIIRSCSNDLIGLLLNLSNVGLHFVQDSLYKRYLGYLSSTIYVKSKYGSESESESGPGSGSEPEEEDEEHAAPSGQEPERTEQKGFSPGQGGLDCITGEYPSMRNLVHHLEYVVGSLFYRREMRQVKEEISIPPIFYGCTYLSQSSIERFFYIKQCEQAFSQMMSHRNPEAFSRNKKELDSLITMLRLACIHPQLGITGISNRSVKGQENSYSLEAHHDSSIASLSTGLRIMTMDQILDKLLNKCRIDIEESVRKYVMNTLGLAGIYYYSKEDNDTKGPARSIFYYKQVLDIRREDRVDVLQQIHTLWNLGEICEDETEKRNLLEECSELETKYRSKYYRNFAEKHEAFTKSRDKTNSLYSMDKWWHAFKRLARIRDHGGDCSEEDLLLDRIENFQYEFKSARDGDLEQGLPSFSSIHGLVTALDLKVQRMQESRELLLGQVRQLELLRLEQGSSQDADSTLGQDPQCQLILDETIAKVSACSICQAGQGSQTEEDQPQGVGLGHTTRGVERRDPCALCVIQTHIEEMEYSLYTIKKKSSTRHTESSSGASRVLAGVGSEEKQQASGHHDSTYLRDSEAVAVLKFLNKELRRVFKLDSSSNDKPEDAEDLTAVSQASTRHIKYIESLKLELSSTKVFVSSTRQLINSYLELMDCKQRIQVIQEGEAGMHSNHNNIIHQSEIPLLADKYESERLSALGMRRNLKSQQKFLCNVKLQQSSKKTNNELQDQENEYEMCPVCLNKLKEDYSQVLLPCAHILCIDCYRLITKRSGGNKAKSLCPKCRFGFQDTNVVLIVPEADSQKMVPPETGTDPEKTQTESLSLGNETPDKEQCRNKVSHLDFGVEFSAIHSERILGNFGTKIEAIIKHIKWILNYSGHGLLSTDPQLGTIRGNDDKIIIFSSFQPAIDILSSALHLNEINFKKYSGGKAEYHVIREFSAKNDNEIGPGGCRVLLCNHFNVGKGVNITAANHVIFVSPLLNKSDELQAIGRIVRMGQTKTPHVWNFVINNSVDELILHYLTNFYSATGDDQTTTTSSTNLQSLNLKVIQHISDTNYSNFKQKELAQSDRL